MNTTLETTTGRQHTHPPSYVVGTRRVRLLDRIALHLGVALITWGRRPRRTETQERRAGRIEQQLARLERERAAERLLRLNVPLR